MSLLKKEYWFICAILNIATLGCFNILIAYMLDLFDENAWYQKKAYWICAFLCLIFPIFIMFLVFGVEMTVQVAKKLNVPGCEIYATQYSWILCLIVPVLGWILLAVMLIYLNVWIVSYLYQGKAEAQLS